MLYGNPQVPPISAVDDIDFRDPRVVAADVRWYLDERDGRSAYRAGHIPGAVWIDLDNDLSAPATAESGRHPLPTAEHFAAALGARGIRDDDLVVAYDDMGGAIAARLVWMLRVVGHEATLLDGGLDAWAGPRETGEAVRPQTRRTPRSWPREWFADLDELVNGNPAERLLLDARAADRYEGITEPVDARPGHIPGAHNLPHTALRDADGHALTEDLARKEVLARGVGAERDVVAYCGSGVTACYVLLQLERLGMPGRLYPGAYSQWAAHDELPIETGTA